MNLSQLFKQNTHGETATVLSQAEIADDVAEKAAFERGELGNATELDLSSVIIVMYALPVGSVLMGCAGQCYTKIRNGVWDEFNGD